MADLTQSLNSMVIPTVIAAANLIILAAPKLLDVAKTAFDWRQKQHEHALKVIESKSIEVPQDIKDSIGHDLLLNTIRNIKRIPVKTCEEMTAIEQFIKRHKDTLTELDVRRSYEQLRFRNGRVGFHLSGIVHGLLLLQSFMALIMLAYLTISAGYVVNDVLHDRYSWEGATIALTIAGGLCTMVIWGPVQLRSIYRVERAIASKSEAEQAGSTDAPAENDGPLN